MAIFYLREPLTGQDRRRAAPTIRRWQQSLYEKQDVDKWRRAFASLEDVLVKTRPRQPVTIYRSVRDKSEVGDVVYDRFTSWTLDPDLGFKYVEGSPDVIARVHPEDIVMTVSAFGKIDHDQMSEVILRPGRYTTVLKPRSRFDHPTPPLSPPNIGASFGAAKTGECRNRSRGVTAGTKLRVSSKAAILRALERDCPVPRMSGYCYPWAVAIHRVFGGQILVAVNERIFEVSDGERMIGHAAVKIGRDLFDGEGLTDRERLESWGSLDPEDAEYAEMAGMSLRAWDSVAHRVAVYEMSESEVLERFPSEMAADVKKIVSCLKAAHEESSCHRLPRRACAHPQVLA